jgi:hypothetical protein
MVGCSVQAYGNTPAFFAVYFQEPAAAISWESNCPPCAVAVCGNGSRLIQKIMSPTFTVTTGGSNCIPSITTVCVTGFGVAAVDGAPPLRSKPSTAAATNREEYTLPSVLNTESTLTGKRGLNHFCMLKMRDKCGSDVN